MKTQRPLLVLTLLNLVLLFCLAAQRAPEPRTDVQPVIRAQVIELVDANGKVRASMLVEPGGEAVFRMRDAGENIRVKIGASEAGSGLLLLNDATEPGLHALAKDGHTSLKLTNQDGAQKLVEP